MQDILGSVRRSLVFRSSLAGDDGGGGGGLSGFVGKINSSIRSSSRIGLFSNNKTPPGLPAPPPRKEEAPPIRWRKGELIGCGAFGRVYMGMNLDSGELLAIKQVHFEKKNCLVNCLIIRLLILFVWLGFNRSEQCQGEDSGEFFFQSLLI